MAKISRTPLAGLMPAAWNSNLVVRHSNHGAQAPHKKKQSEYNELCLVSSHQATHNRANGGNSTVDSQLFYRLRSFRVNNDPAKHLTINPDGPFCGYMPQEEYEVALRNGSPDGPSRGVAAGGTPFDFSAVCYVAGFVCARTLLGMDVKLPDPDGLSIYSFYAHFDIHSGNEVILTKGLYSSQNELATLLCFLKICGVRTVFTTAKTVSSSGKKLAERALGNYALGLACSIIAAAENVGCGAAHLLAWFRGTTAGMTLCCHNDEGGWLRRPLKRAEYVTPAGIVPAEVKAAFDYPKNCDYRDVDVGGRILELVFLCYRCVSAADPRVGDNPVGTVIPRDVSPPTQTASDFSTLQTAFEAWQYRFVCTIGKAAGLSHGPLDLMHTFRPYWSNPPVDKHLKESPIMPFFMVEPSPFDVFPDVEDAFMSIGNPLKRVTIPLLGKNAIAAVPMRGYYSSVNSTGIRGGRVRFVTNGFTLRSLGLAYVWAGEGAHNFLMHVRPVSDPDRGYNQRDLAFARDSRTGSLAESRWVLPHAPIPNPMELWGGSRRRMFEVVFSGSSAQGALEDLRNGQVSMACSPLYFSATTTAPLPTCARSLPKWAARELHKLNRYADYCGEMEQIYDELPPWGSEGSGEVSPLWLSGVSVTPVKEQQVDPPDTVLVQPAVTAPPGGITGEDVTLALEHLGAAPLGTTVFTPAAQGAALNLQARNLPPATAATLTVANLLQETGRNELATGDTTSTEPLSQSLMQSADAVLLPQRRTPITAVDAAATVPTGGAANLLAVIPPGDGGQ